VLTKFYRIRALKGSMIINFRVKKVKMLKTISSSKKILKIDNSIMILKSFMKIFRTGIRLLRITIISNKIYLYIIQ